MLLELCAITSMLISLYFQSLEQAQKKYAVVPFSNPKECKINCAFVKKNLRL
jgi:hypothetical protein